MTPARGLAALCAAFTAGLTLTLVVLDSSGESSDGQRVITSPGEEAADETETVVALADVANRSLLRVPGQSDDSDAPGAASSGDGTDGSESAGALSVDLTGTDSDPSQQDGDATGASTAASGTAGTTPSSEAGSSTTGAPSNGTRTSDSSPSTAAPTTGSTSTRPSSTAPTTAPPTTQGPTTTVAPTTAAPTTQPSTNGGNNSGFEAIRNNDPLFSRYANVPSSQLSIDALTIPASPADNGAHPHGNFRMACAYSHFAYDDPIVFPGQSGRSHLHMFFGNTAVDAHTTTNSLVNSGGSSCNGFELNRSGYWTPAVLDGKGNAVVPDQIILYYKTTMPSQTVAMPQGLKMVAGNTTSESFTAGQRLGWSCGASGVSYNKSNRIPNNCGSDPVNAYIQFPNCWDGRNLDSSDHISHMYFANDNQACPGSHPVRLPQITILLYFPAGDTSGWYLSSDRSGGFNTGSGATLHADWFGGWNDDAMNLWINGCIRASRNCSYGQTGTSRMFAKLNNLQDYPGNNFLPLP
ncbi:MAG: DUF1996 domain-containing protein [Actinomycetota bacterium]